MTTSPIALRGAARYDEERPEEPMCGRFALTAPVSTLVEIFGVDVPADASPKYNIAPTAVISNVVSEPGSGRRLIGMRWGLIPSWAEGEGQPQQTINARAETVARRPTFRDAFARRRSLVLADGFYEWERAAAGRIPHLFQLASGEPFAMAGLWDTWRSAAGEEIRSCAVVTTRANERMAPVHDRMPVVLPRAAWDAWLDPQTDAARLDALMVPYPSEQMRSRRVSEAVGNVRNQGPEVQAPYAPRELALPFGPRDGREG